METLNDDLGFIYTKENNVFKVCDETGFSETLVAQSDVTLNEFVEDYAHMLGNAFEQKYKR